MIEEIRNIAASWRLANQENPGGVVLVWQGAVYGWKDELRDAKDEQPGAFAVDASGKVFIAEGGDDYNGAERWVAAPDSDSSSVWPDLFLPDKDAKPFDLSRLDPFTSIVLTRPMGPRPDADYFRIAQLADGLNGKEFAMLTDDELQRFRQLQREGRKFGLCVWVEVLNDGDDVQAELAAASWEQKEAIYRRLRTQIAVRWAVIDSQASHVLRG
nr:hypothetical protein [uncultured bacterium]